MSYTYEQARDLLIVEITRYGTWSEDMKYNDPSDFEEFLETPDFSDPLSERILGAEHESARYHLEYLASQLEPEIRAALEDGDEDYREDDLVLTALESAGNSSDGWAWTTQSTVNCFVAVHLSAEDDEGVGDDLSGLPDDVGAYFKGTDIEVMSPKYPHSVVVGVEMLVKDFLHLVPNQKYDKTLNEITLYDPALTLWCDIEGSGDTIDYAGPITVKSPEVLLESGYPGYAPEISFERTYAAK